MKHTRLLFVAALFLLTGLTGILPAQTVIPVTAGVDAISTAYATAPTGSILELTTSGGDYIQSNNITINKDVTIRAAAGLAQKPVIYCAGSSTFDVTNGGLTLSGVKFDDDLHGNPLSAYFISVKADTILTSTKFRLKVDNCEFAHCAQRAIYTSDGTMHPLDTLLVTNSLFIDNVKQPIYSKGIRNTPGNPCEPGGARYIKWENCLIVGTSSSSDGYATYIEPANRDDSTKTWPTVILNHITVDSMAIGGISTYTTPNATVQNCIVVNMKDTARYPYQVETGRWSTAPRSHVINCLYNGPRFVSYGSSAFAKYPDTAKIIQANPVFKNVAARDYTLMPGSPGKGAATDGMDLGYIPGGLTPAAQVIPVTAGVDAISAAFATAPAGSVLELTTSGGDYVQSNNLTINKDITIRAATGLAQKPVIYCAGSSTFDVTNGGLTLSGVKFDDDLHGNPLSAYFISVKADTILTSTHFNLKVDNCEFTHCAQRSIYTSDGTMHPMDTLLVTNSWFIDNVKQAIYEKGIRNTPSNPCQPGGAKFIKFENCLIVGSSSTSDGYATYIEPANRDDSTKTWPTVILNHITVDSMALGGISTYTTPNAMVQNCIVVNMKDTARYPYQVETGRWSTAPRSHVINCLYNGPRFVSYGSSAFAKYPDTAKIIQANPIFKNIAARDYTLMPGSPGKGAATDGKDLGYIPGGLTDVKPPSTQVPETFQLSQNYPNPFNPATTIEFSVPKAGRYTVEVFNILGQRVASLFDDQVVAGNYAVHFDASRLASGIYIYSLKGNGVGIARKMALLR